MLEAFVLGILVGFVFFSIFTPTAKEPSAPVDLSALLQAQVQQQQIQTMMRESQLQALRQEAEYRELMQQRNQALRFNNLDAERAVMSVISRGLDQGITR